MIIVYFKSTSWILYVKKRPQAEWCIWTIIKTSFVGGRLHAVCVH